MGAQLLNRCCLNFLGFSLQCKLLLNDFAGFQEFESSVNRVQDSQQYLQSETHRGGMYHLMQPWFIGNVLHVLL